METSAWCVVSDCLKHDTIAVHAFQSKLLEHVKEVHPQVNKIFYFSDSAASQYKNFL